MLKLCENKNSLHDIIYNTIFIKIVFLLRKEKFYDKMKSNYKDVRCTKVKDIYKYSYKR